jgi:hypothetical protein
MHNFNRINDYSTLSICEKKKVDEKILVNSQITTDCIAKMKELYKSAKKKFNSDKYYKNDIEFILNQANK